MNPTSLYLNWVCYAVYGMMAHADDLQRRAGDAIGAVADELQRRFPIQPMPLYRGMLLDDADSIRPEPNLQFLSWSEDLDVARWFGSPTSFISAPFSERYPHVRGFVLTLERAPQRVLFHHSWRNVFGRPLEQFALMHPQMGTEGYRQVKWSLDKQREVITEPLVTLPRPEPVANLIGPSIDELDRRFSPPWVGSDQPHVEFIQL